MKGIFRKASAWLLVLAMVLSMVIPGGMVYADGGQVKITILATSDIHGRIYPWDYAIDSATDNTGFAKVYSVVKEVRKENPNTILIDNGDTIQDNMASLFNGEEIHPMVQAMNMMGYDAWTLGNHEFNFGLDVLGRAIKGSKAPVLAANIYKADGTRFVKPYIIKEVQGVKIAIVGMISPHIPRWEASTPKNFEGLTFTEPAEETKKVLAELKGKADIIIGSYHIGEEGEYGSQGVGDIVKENPEFAAMIAGHAHSDIPGKDINGVLIVEPKAYGNKVSRIDFTLEQKDGKWVIVDQNSQNIDTKGYPSDREMEEAFKTYHDRAREEVNTVIGKVTANFLDNVNVLPGIPTAQVQDTALIDFINEVQMHYTGADVSAAALFDAKSNVLAGDFKKKDVANIYKYENTLMAVKVTGKELKAFMEEYGGKYFNTYQPGDVTISFDPNIRGYNFDMFAGVDYEIDISKPAGQRITNLKFKGKPVTDDMELTLAVNNYRYGGLLKAGIIRGENKVYDSYEKYGDAGRIRDLIVKYVQEKGTITPKTDHNWKIVGADLNHVLKDEVYDLVKKGHMVIPTSADGRTPNVKALNVYDLIRAGKLPYKNITILHTNDTHSRIEWGKNDGMGFDKIATMVRNMKAKNPNTLVIDAGDAFHGQTIATLGKGESVAKVMDKIGYDAMAPGNHDFNYGQERLLALDQMTKFPILAANIKKADGTNLLTPYVIKEMDGIKVGIFGLATPETAYKTHPNNVKGLVFEDPVKAAGEMVKELQSKTDVIVAVTHLGLDESSMDTSKKVAENVDGIDIIIDGHSHTVLKNGLAVGKTLIAQAGEYDKNLGIVDLYLKDGKVVHKYATLFGKAAAEGIGADGDIKALIAAIKGENEKITSVVVGKSSVTLDGERGHVRTGETNLGNLITDAMLEVTKADVALTNGGGIRASINEGEITKGEVITVLPFGNYVVVKALKGSDLLAALEHGVSAYPNEAGHFAHVAGLTYKFNPNKPAGQRITEVMVGGEKLDINKTYKVATNDFLAAGGDKYDMFKTAPTLGEYPGLDEITIQYIAAKGTVDAKVQGRIVAAEQAPVLEKAPMQEKVPTAEKVKEYTVKAGDVLWKIAKQFGLSYEKLVEFNNIKNPHRIFPGQKLLIP
ncbi:5'-nucleotidase C-terminal domain-containing protein [Thermotalea metallivorans]|uniref:Trifunctional nucleotide phosphoesterase protein YfkN n=1 Tax=Thermotalea metallivorans TaxID=520762 RepID=A0A140LDL5_9FIRM|nr:5'-nucleotidase C-terminal domain-containing protein [Thermotalea metallivorans]KXG78640.1 Trifunctional nucleotide phosphoesterase protein YfkN [Thermotalea metallivorans]